MSIVDARNLRKAYGPQTILDDVSVTLQPGERVGVVGVNGSGKSTLGSILAGAETPDTGELSYRRGARLAYLLQVPHFDPERSVLDEALAGLEAWNRAHARYEEATRALSEQRGSMEAWLQTQSEAINDIERLGGWDATHRAEAVLSNLGLKQHDAKLGTLSGGEKRRVALARALVSQPDLLVLDEPTNHLDLESIEWLEQHLAEELQGALLLITHDRYLLNRVARRTLELEGGKLYSYDGGFEAYLEGKAERLAHQARVESNRQNFLRQELEWLRRQPKARTTKSKARVDRAQEALQQKGPAPARRLSLQMQTARSGKTILELHELRLEIPGRTLVRDLTLHLTQGERMGILGPNGSGKTTLLRAVLDELRPDAGRIVIGQNARLGYLSQARSGLDDEASVLDNVGAGSGYVQLGQQRIDARSYLERFLFRPDKQRQPVGSLSGGERTRVALAKLLSEPANLLLLDEPTNDLDIDTLAALEEMLLEQNGTALVVTHDRWFLDRIATGILVAEGDGRWTPYQGDYTTVRVLRKQERAEAAEAKPATKRARRTDSSRPAGKPKRRAALTYGERLELERIMDDIEAAESHVAALEKDLADPDIYQKRGDDVPDLVEELDQAKAEAERLMQRWEELEAKKAAD